MLCVARPYIKIGVEVPILTIDRSILFNGRNSDITWFHPKVGFMPGKALDQPPVAVMCCQSITGSDVFGPFPTTSEKPGLHRSRSLLWDATILILPDGKKACVISCRTGI